MISLQSLFYLQKIAETQSINKAAENLYISKSALSTAVKNLENEFGIALLNRSVQGVTLTDAGKMVVEGTTSIFNILNHMRDECRHYNDNHNEINFFMDERFSNSVFPHIMVGLKQMQPNTYITAQNVIAFEEIFDRVAEDENGIGLFLEMGLVIDENRYPNIGFHRIDTYEVCVATAKYSKHIPVTITSLNYEELAKIPQIELMESSRTYGLYDAWTESSMPAKQNYVMSTDNNMIYFQAILNDFGVGQILNLPIPYGVTNRNKIRMIPIENPDKANLWMVYNKKMNRILVDHLLTSLKAIMNVQEE